MASEYYIDHNGEKDGPYDVITLMRRIRVGKLASDALVYCDGDETPQPAAAIEELSGFFSAATESNTPTPQTLPSLTRLLTNAWNYVIDNSITTVYAGGLVLVTAIISIVSITLFGYALGIAISWISFCVLHSIYMIFTLRKCRGQTLSSDFVSRYLSPIFPTLVFCGAAMGLGTLIGFSLLIIPGFLVLIGCIYMPFFLLDYHEEGLTSLRRSIMMLKKQKGSFVGMTSVLVLMHILCIILILPVPISLPLFSAALAELYESQ